MNVDRAGTQTKAFWISQDRFDRVWDKEGKDYVTRQEMLRGHAAGWIAGVTWARRQQKRKAK